VSGLQDIGDLGFLCLMGILSPLRLFFRYLEKTYPPILKCSEANDVKKSLYTITIWKIWGGLTFQPLVDCSWAITEFECLDSAAHNVAWGYQKPKKVHSQCHYGDEDYTSNVLGYYGIHLNFFPQSYSAMI
jgi:hypothetical protein